MIHIGIDPGKEGALVSLNTETNEVLIKKIPLIKGSREIDDHELNLIISNIREFKHHVVIEDLKAIYGVASNATFALGDVCGLIRGMLVANNIRFTKVDPRTWQKEMFQGIKEIRKPNTTRLNRFGKPTIVKGRIETKAMSILAAKRLFPNVSLKTSNVKNAVDKDGISDALLMAEYSRRKFS